VTPFDPAVFPRTAAYLADLPGGLDAYPRCRVRTSVTREITDQFPQALDTPGIDPTVVELVRGAIRRDEWMPEAYGLAVRLVVRDILFQTDADYHRWYYEIAGKIFAKPIYRVLMYVVSPTLVMLGAQKRWAAFREGTTLSAKIDRNQGEIELKFPEKLYPELILVGFGEAFRASVVAARARNAKVELIEAAVQHARWRISWQ
jgi:hypothetical protein